MFRYCMNHDPKYMYDADESQLCPRCGGVGDPVPALEKVDPDPVEWPAHYNQGNIECIDAMVSAFGMEYVVIYCRLAAFKYMWRFKHKGRAEEDLNKAIWYLRFSLGDDPRKESRP